MQNYSNIFEVECKQAKAARDSIRGQFAIVGFLAATSVLPVLLH